MLAESYEKETYETSFIVYPNDCNDCFPLIFGGALFSYMDKAASALVRKILTHSDCCSAGVTHQFGGTFYKPCYLSDLIALKASFKSIGKKSITVLVQAFRELKLETPKTDEDVGKKYQDSELVAQAEFVFVAIKNTDSVKDKPDLLPYYHHHLGEKHE